MRSFSHYAAFGAVLLALAAPVVLPDSAAATPDPNSAVLRLRIFNDCPSSILTTTNNYPELISIRDERLDCPGFANLHNWRFSEDGVNPAVFNNADCFKFQTFLVISGTAEGEAGLQISPWFSQDVDGRLNVRTSDGEIACFGGRLPFYSFSNSHGLRYTKGTAIYLQITYHPNSLTEADPGTIEYVVGYNNALDSSGFLPFDQGNPEEDPPYGLWGILNDARVGGHLQPFLQNGNPDANLQADFSFIKFDPLECKVVPVESSSWGRIKAIYER
jgi:hypothetical protein